MEGQYRRRSPSQGNYNVHRLGLALSWVCVVSHVASISDQFDPQSISLRPAVEYLGPLGTLTLSQLPKGRVKKVLLVLEALNTLPYEFWDRSRSCPSCIGHPENRKIVIDALARNYAVIIPQSLVSNGDWEAWPEDSPDLLNVVFILTHWKRTHGLENVPTVGLGISAGGHCLSTLALRPGLFDSIAIMISKGRAEAWEAVTHNYPPTIFIYMPKDTDTAKRVSELRTMLASKAIATQEAVWLEHRLTRGWFARLVPGVDVAMSEAIIEAFKADGSIVDENNIITVDPIYERWADILRESGLLPEKTRQVGDAIIESFTFQEAKVAFAHHTTIARKDDEMFAWFEGGHDDDVHGEEARATF